MMLTKLRDALAKATGPDRWLDKAILLYFGYTWRGMAYWRDNPEKMWIGPTEFTASIDAAVTLFGPEWLLIILSDIAADGLSLAKFSTTETPVQEAVGIGGRTLALTICLARVEYEIARAALKKLEE